jgi:hypothetical protein
MVSGDLLTSIQDLSISQTVRKSLWAFPALECIHLYSMVFLITVVATFDMRLMGSRLAQEAQPLSKLSRLAFVVASLCFGVNLVTGTFLFAYKSTDYYITSAFCVKLLLILIAVGYQLFLFSLGSKWSGTPANSLGQRLAGFTSLALWIGVIAESRWIAFV